MSNLNVEYRQFRCVRTEKEFTRFPHAHILRAGAINAFGPEEVKMNLKDIFVPSEKSHVVLNALKVRGYTTHLIPANERSRFDSTGLNRYDKTVVGAEIRLGDFYFKREDLINNVKDPQLYFVSGYNELHKQGGGLVHLGNWEEMRKVYEKNGFDANNEFTTLSVDSRDMFQRFIQSNLLNNPAYNAQQLMQNGYEHHPYRVFDDIKEMRQETEGNYYQNLMLRQYTQFNEEKSAPQQQKKGSQHAPRMR